MTDATRVEKAIEDEQQRHEEDCPLRTYRGRGLFKPECACIGVDRSMLLLDGSDNG